MFRSEAAFKSREIGWAIKGASLLASELEAGTPLRSCRLNPVLRMALVAGVESAVRVHIERGDNINARDLRGQTPLMIAAARNKPGICMLLLAAGADVFARDISGKTAHELAAEVGATQALATLPPLPLSNSDASSHSEWTGIEDEGDAHITFDWEPEPATERPQRASESRTEAADRQKAISDHIAEELFADWNDPDLYLPARAAPIEKVEDPEARTRLRLILLRAVREGSVPEHLLSDFAADQERGEATVAERLGLCLEAMGVDLDERIEDATRFEDFRPFVNPEASEEEDETVAAALEYCDNISATTSEPLHRYLREAYRYSLIDGEQEALLGQTMEAQRAVALDSLSGWPGGMACVLAQARDALMGKMEVSRIASDLRDEPLPTDSDLSASGEMQTQLNTEAPTPLEEENDEDSQNTTASCIEQILALNHLSRQAETDNAARARLREALGRIPLQTEFLLRLGEHAAADGHPCALLYQHAAAKLRLARDQLAQANVRLVIGIAKRYLNSGISLEDLIQGGNVGLLRAVDKFDWRRGFKFSTYAVWWVRQAVSRLVADTSRLVRVPVHLHQTLYQVDQIRTKFERERAGPLADEELANLAGISLAKLAMVRRASTVPVSLDELGEDDAASALAETQAFSDPLETAHWSELRETIEDVLHTLSDVEEYVIRQRFGIGTGRELTLAEVGSAMGVTRERIRQIEAKALRKLKHPSRLDRLRALLLNSEPDNKDRKDSAQSYEREMTVGGATEEGDPLEREFKNPWRSQPDKSVAEPAAPPFPRASAPGEHDDISQDDALHNCVHSLGEFWSAESSENSLARDVHRNTAESICTTTVADLPPLQGYSDAIRRLAQLATSMGVTVEDGRADGNKGGVLWIKFTESPRDGKTRQLVRTLYELGFNFAPGGGYWR